MARKDRLGSTDTFIFGTLSDETYTLWKVLMDHYRYESTNDQAVMNLCEKKL